MTDLLSGPALARSHMVDSQVRPNQVSDARVIAAMRALPREDFAPAGSRVYADADVALGNGRVLLSPLAISRLVQLVLEGAPRSVLVIGAGAGYGAAVLALSGVAVTALESDAALETGALARHAPEVRRIYGKLANGDPGSAPYDAIFIEGAVSRLPEELAGQLAPGGRLVTVLANGAARGQLGAAVVARLSGKGYAVAKRFDVAAPVIPEFSAAPAFVF